jgi:hypothetical protein
LPFLKQNSFFRQQNSFGRNQVKQWWARAQEGGIAIVAEALARANDSWGNILQPVVLTDLQGKGHVRPRSLSAESLFGYFCGDKSN